MEAFNTWISLNRWKALSVCDVTSAVYTSIKFRTLAYLPQWSETWKLDNQFYVSSLYLPFSHAHASTKFFPMMSGKGNTQPKQMPTQAYRHVESISSPSVQLSISQWDYPEAPVTGTKQKRTKGCVCHIRHHRSSVQCFKRNRPTFQCNCTRIHILCLWKQ